MEVAPFHTDVADAPEGVACRWIRTGDGLRLRIAAWSEGRKGTVLLFPGRTEYVEKYGRAAADFARRGFAMVAVDWRGQGLSDRMHEDPQSGHVNHFPDYQADVRAVVDAAAALDLPRPYYLVAHSMGGAIGLRALYEGLDVQASAFSAPMWGITMSRALRPIAWSLSWASRSLGFNQKYTPGTKRDSYVTETGFAQNMLTTDADMYAYMHAQVSAHPELVLGGPSLHWLYEALTETRSLAARPAPRLPCFTAVGEEEQIVDSDRIAVRMKTWLDGSLDVIEKARHEVMMETPEIRKHFFDTACTLFAEHR